jgi:hypothetical protein
MTWLLLPAVGFAAGVAFGYQVMAKPYIWLGTIGRSFSANQYAQLQTREASYPEARVALTAYISYLNHSKPVSDPCVGGETPWLDARGLRFDKTLACVRLAVLDESNGNSPGAEAAWREVDTLVAQGTWKDRSHQHFRDLIARMDRVQEPVPPKPSPTAGGT